jgi:hypothetical protein
VHAQVEGFPSMRIRSSVSAPASAISFTPSPSTKRSASHMTLSTIRSLFITRFERVLKVCVMCLHHAQICSCHFTRNASETVCFSQKFQSISCLRCRLGWTFKVAHVREQLGKQKASSSSRFRRFWAASVAAAVAVEEEVEVALLVAVLPRKWRTQQA